MSPAPKKSKKKAAAEAEVTASKKKGKGKRRKAAEVDEDEDEDEGQEATDKKRGRRARDYGVTGEQLHNMREEDGMSWQEIQDEVGAKSAIPLRKILHAYLAEQDDDLAIDIDDGEAIVEARDEEGLGWGQIAARANSTVAEVKAAYKEAGGKNVEGRAYKDKEGNVHFRLGSNGASEAADEEDADEEESEYASMDRAELVSELKERGLSTKGKTAVLIQRLTEDDAAEEVEEDEEEDEPAPTPRKAKGKKGKKAGR